MNGELNEVGRGLTARSAALAIVLVCFLAGVTPYTDLFVRGSRLAGAHLPTGVVVLFLLLVGLNGALRRLSPRLSLGREELLYAYCAALFCAALPSSGFVGFLPAVVAGPTYFATSVNRWEELFLKHLPPWMNLKDRWAAELLYRGLRRGEFIPLTVWLLPLLFWCFFALLYFLAVYCLGLMLRRRWIEEERLSFPLAQVPLTLTAQNGSKSLPSEGGLFGDLLFWAGLAGPLLIHSLNCLSTYIPLLPHVRLTALPIFAGLTEPPFEVLSGETLSLYFSIVGVGYLVTAEISFSFWFFYFLHLARKVALRWMGFKAGLGVGGITPLSRAQEVGAFLTLALVLLLPLLKSREARRTGRWFLLLNAMLIGALWASGMSPLMALSILSVWYCVHVVLARIVNAGGVMLVECSFVPWDPLIYVAGLRGVGVKNLTLMGPLQQLFMFDQVTVPLPYTLDCFKIAHSAGLRLRHLHTLIWACFPLAVGISVVSSMLLLHSHGAANLTPWFTSTEPVWPLRKLEGWVSNPPGTDWFALLNILIGAGMTGGLLWLHRRFPWWPLHPIGFVMASTHTMRTMWFSLLLGWLFHVSILRYGGHNLFRRLRPFFIGLIIGELFAAGLWTGIGALTGRSHPIFPG